MRLRSEVRSRLAPLLLWAVTVGVACGPPARPPIDAKALPEGTGWHCYQHEEAGTSREQCYRDRDDCAAKGTADGGKACTAVDQAFCADLHPAAEPHDVRCLGTEEDCEAIARASSGGATRCTAVP
jgi:hypothetical protein